MELISDLLHWKIRYQEYQHKMFRFCFDFKLNLLGTICLVYSIRRTNNTGNVVIINTYWKRKSFLSFRLRIKQPFSYLSLFEMFYISWRLVECINLLWTRTGNCWWTNNDLNVPLAIAFLRSKMVLFWNRAVSFIMTRKLASAKPVLLLNRTNFTPIIASEVFLRNTWANSRSTMRLFSSKRLDMKSASSLVKFMLLMVNVTCQDDLS